MARNGFSCDVKIPHVLITAETNFVFKFCDVSVEGYCILNHLNLAMRRTETDETSIMKSL